MNSYTCKVSSYYRMEKLASQGNLRLVDSIKKIPTIHAYHFHKIFNKEKSANCIKNKK